jgi:hypothetical protein
VQNRYAGDIGDYIKLALLRVLGAGRRIGVAWYLYPDEEHNGDGRHTSYIAASKHWRHLDPELFDLLAKTVKRERSVCALGKGFGSEAVFSTTPVPTSGVTAKDRCSARTAWFQGVLADLQRCDLIFADPDNGLVDDKPQRRTKSSFGKQIPLSEVRALSAGRTSVIYHHNSRFKGGHDVEVNHWLSAIGSRVVAVRAAAYSCRTFFIINPDDQLMERATEFCERWKNHKVRLHQAV